LRGGCTGEHQRQQRAPASTRPSHAAARTRPAWSS
jgi:hypothetical protein